MEQLQEMRTSELHSAPRADTKGIRITGREPSERTRGSGGGQDVSLILALRFHPVKTPPFCMSSKL